MRIGYTIWRRSSLSSLILSPESPPLNELVDFYVLVFPFLTDGKRVKLADKPFIPISLMLAHAANMVKKTGKPYWVKVQYHPIPKTLPSGALPKWWPGYVSGKGQWFSAVMGKLAGALSRICTRIVGREPEVVVPAVEIASLVNELDWNKIVKDVKDKVDSRVIYGGSFWQPIRTKYDGLISWLYKWGWGRWVISSIMKGTPYENANAQMLADIAYRAKLNCDRMSDLDAIGLSAYFYPSMGTGVDPGKIMRKYRRWLFSLDYVESALEWAYGLKKELVVSETGVVYNAPIAHERDAVIRWFVDSFKVWQDAGIGELVIWDEVQTEWVVEALKRFRGSRGISS